MKAQPVKSRLRTPRLKKRVKDPENSGGGKIQTKRIENTSSPPQPMAMRMA